MGEQNRTLQVLVFYGKALTGRGIASFVRCIKDSPSLPLSELVIGGSEFADDDAQALAHAVASRKETAADMLLQRFALLNVNLGDASVYGLADLVMSGLTEVTILAGKLTDEGAAILARSALGLVVPSSASEEEVVPTKTATGKLQSFCLATSAAGNVGLTAFSSAWDGGAALPICELAFGSSTSKTCEELMLKVNSSDYPVQASGLSAHSLRCAASSNTSTDARLAKSNSPGSCGWLLQRNDANLEAAASGSQPLARRLSVTCDLPKYLEEVLFSRLMLRSDYTMWTP